VAFDFRKLEGRIVEKFGTRSNFAVAAGFTNSQLSARLNNKVFFDSDEIIRLCTPELLDIPAVEIPVYFFTVNFR
jgi:hypothetical protein